MTPQEMEKIARENAIKELKEFQIDIGSCQDDLNNSSLYYALDIAIKALEQQPKIGYWRVRNSEEQDYGTAGIKTWYTQIVCSKCGWIKTAIEGLTRQYHYCPNCGAKMTAESEK